MPYGEEFPRGDITFRAYVCELTLSDPDGFTLTPGSSGTFVAPAARDQGKPGLDRVEFARQLTGQQQGLNHLAVADFLANRHAAFSFYEGFG